MMKMIFMFWYQTCSSLFSSIIKRGQHKIRSSNAVQHYRHVHLLVLNSPDTDLLYSHIGTVRTSPCGVARVKSSYGLQTVACKYKIVFVIVLLGFKRGQFLSDGRLPFSFLHYSSEVKPSKSINTNHKDVFFNRKTQSCSKLHPLLHLHLTPTQIINLKPDIFTPSYRQTVADWTK